MNEFEYQLILYYCLFSGWQRYNNVLYWQRICHFIL